MAIGLPSISTMVSHGSLPGVAHRFPGIEGAAKRLGVGTAILDGEAVVLDEEGRPDFGRLQNSLGGRGGELPAGNAIMFAFDLLYFDRHDIRSMELAARRYFLRSLLEHEDGAIRLSEEIEGDGREIFAAACEHGLEGIIAKYKDSPYRSGRLGEWGKVKGTQSDSFIVVGYEHSLVARPGIGSLLLAARKGDDWVYVPASTSAAPSISGRRSIGSSARRRR